MDNNQTVFQSLGRIEGQLGGISTQIKGLAEQLVAHIQDDAKLAARIMAMEIDQARFSGAEASKTRRNAGIAGLAGAVLGAAGGILSRWSLGH